MVDRVTGDLFQTLGVLSILGGSFIVSLFYTGDTPLLLHPLVGSVASRAQENPSVEDLSTPLPSPKLMQVVTCSARLPLRPGVLEEQTPSLLRIRQVIKWSTYSSIHL